MRVLWGTLGGLSRMVKTPAPVVRFSGFTITGTATTARHGYWLAGSRSLIRSMEARAIGIEVREISLRVTRLVAITRAEIAAATESISATRKAIKRTQQLLR